MNTEKLATKPPRQEREKEEDKLDKLKEDFVIQILDKGLTMFANNERITDIIGEKDYNDFIREIDKAKAKINRVLRTKTEEEFEEKMQEVLQDKKTICLSGFSEVQELQENFTKETFDDFIKEFNNDPSVAISKYRALLQKIEETEKETEEEDILQSVKKIIEQIKEGKRIGGVVFFTEKAEELLEQENIKYIKIEEFPEEMETPPSYAVGKNEILQEALPKEKLKTLNLSAIKDRIEERYEEIKEMSVVQAMHYLNSYQRERKVRENAEVSALEGLIFGYKPCCVDYYVKTRYLGEPIYEEEKLCTDENKGYILCPSCAKEKGKI